MNARILVVDDDAEIRSALEMTLSYERFAVLQAGRGKEALELCARERPDMVLLDVKMPGMDGIEVLGRLHEQWPELPVVMISGHADIALAVSAVKKGAFDFLEKPLDQERLLLSVRNALASLKLRAENHELRQRLLDRYRMLGSSPALAELNRVIARAAPTDARILITGENGTGKELVAHQVHLLSKRAAGPFVAVNCAAIPHELIESELFGHEKGSFTGATADRKGHFETATGGTMFLDEIGEMSPGAQAKVLRALEDNVITRVGGKSPVQVDVRVVSATNRDLEKEVEAGRFRQDLYFRLRVIPMQVPPLRDRPDDVGELAMHFLTDACKRNGQPVKTFSAEALAQLKSFPWPGNVRELRNLIEGLAVLTDGKVVDKKDVQELARPGQSSPLGEFFAIATIQEFSDAVEKEFIRRKLQENAGNIKRTAERIQIMRSNLYKKLDRYGLR